MEKKRDQIDDGYLQVKAQPALNHFFKTIITQRRTRDFHLGGAVYSQVKTLNDKIEFLRYYLRGFSNHMGPTAPAWQHLGPPLSEPHPST